MKLLLILMFLFLNNSCENLSFKKDDELSLKREDYTGNQLRIDGYYYLEYFNPEKHMEAFVFFQNGVMTYLGGGFSSTISIENSMQSDVFIEKLTINKDCWGIFEVNEKVIKLERWYAGQGAKPAFVSEGVILNDTTFHITKIYRGNGSELKERDETYHFRQFSPKPDSTNNFIQ